MLSPSGRTAIPHSQHARPPSSCRSRVGRFVETHGCCLNTSNQWSRLSCPSSPTKVSVAHRPKKFPILASYSPRLLLQAGRVQFLPQPRGKASNRALAVRPHRVVYAQRRIRGIPMAFSEIIDDEGKNARLRARCLGMPSQRLPTNIDGVKSARTMDSRPDFNETCMYATMHVTGHPWRLLEHQARREGQRKLPRYSSIPSTSLRAVTTRSNASQLTALRLSTSRPCFHPFLLDPIELWLQYLEWLAPGSCNGRSSRSILLCCLSLPSRHMPDQSRDRRQQNMI